MVQNPYKPIFTIRTLHSYFVNGRCTCIQFLPIRATVKILNQYDLIIKRITNDYMLFGHSNIKELLGIIKDADFFEFQIINTSPQFYLFTEFPGSASSWLYETGANTNVIHDGSVQLVGQPSTESNSEFGTVKIHFKDIIDLIDQGSPINFNIKFETQHVEIEYIIINRSDFKLNEPQIKSSLGWVFDGPKTITLPDGQTGMSFRSGSELVALSEVPNVNCSLIDSNGGSPLIIFKGLPGVGLEKITRTDAGLLSSMYVYL